MPQIQKILFFLIALLFFFVVFELVRKKSMIENLSWLWILISFLFLVILFQYDYLAYISSRLHASTTAVIMFFAIIGINFLILQLSIMNSTQTRQIKNLSQKIALLENQIDQSSESEPDSHEKE